MALASERAVASDVPKQAVVPAREVTSTTAILLLALLTIAAAWLRLSHLGSKSLWLDEGATVALARATWQHFAWVWWHGEANLQTVYFLLMRAWIRGGLSEAWLRLPSALFGIASVPLMYVVARRLTPGGAALASAALLAFSPAHVYYSHEARSYTLTIFLVLLSSYFFVRAVEEGRRRDWVLWTVFGILAFYSHDFAALVLVAQVCSLLFRKTSPATWRRVTFCGLLVLVVALPGLTYVFRASPENLHFIWMPQATPKEIWHLVGFFGGSGVKAVLALILWIAGLVAIARTRGRDSEAFWRGMLIVSWAVLPALITALVSLRHPIFMQRYLIFSLPAAILLAAVGMTALRKMYIGTGLVVALCAMSIPAILKDYHKPREDWRAASNAILGSAQAGDAVVFFPFYTRTMLDYYRDRDRQTPPAVHVFAPPFYGAGEDEHDLLRALDADPQQFRHVWVVLYGPGAHGDDLEQRNPALAAKLQFVFGPPMVRQFTDISVQEFGK
jgi:mannosyltransferase